MHVCNGFEQSRKIILCKARKIIFEVHFLYYLSKLSFAFIPKTSLVIAPIENNHKENVPFSRPIITSTSFNGKICLGRCICQ